MITLAGMLLEHGEALEADLARFYPRDADQLPEFYAGRMSWRRLWVLVQGLPFESALNEAMNGGPEIVKWDRNVEILAQIRDLIANLDWHFVSANSRHQTPAPKPLPRPEGLRHGA